MGYKTIEGYANALPEKLKGYIEHFVKVRDEIIIIRQYKCSETVYNYSKDGFQVKAALYQHMINSQVYSITCTATEEAYIKYEPIFDKVGRSFEVR